MVEVETVGWELVLKQILQCAAGKSNLHVISRRRFENEYKIGGTK